VATSEPNDKPDYSLIPATIRDVYRKLEEEVIWTHERWNAYLVLFREKPERVQLMNALAPSFFHDLQEIWADDVFLHICRLTDPPRRGKYERLSLGQILDGLEAGTDSALLTRLANLLSTAEANAKPLRRHRDLRIAHLDKATLLGQTTVAGVSVPEVEDALLPIRDFMNAVRLHFMAGEMCFTHLLRYDNAETLIYFLKRAYAYHELEEEEVPKGTWEYMRRIQEGPFKNA
jgi:hypothetical protein